MTFAKLSRLFKTYKPQNRVPLAANFQTLMPKNEKEDLFRDQSNGITNYFQKEYESGKRVIALFAVGGGNDTYSALHLGAYLKEKFGYKIIFFGALGLTPYHSDQDLNQEEKPVIKASANFRRFLQTKPLKEIKNNEQQLPKLLEMLELADSPYYLYSPKYDPAELAQHVKTTIDYELKRLNRTPDELIEVVSDYGADFIGHDLSTISPELDGISVQLCDAIYPSVKKLALIFWPGVDGELSQSTLLKRLGELKDFILAKSQVDDKSSYFNNLKKVYDQIKESRAGNTIPNAINILSGQGKGVLTKTLTSKKGYSVEEKWELDITEDLVRTTTLLPLKGIMAINPFAHIKYQDLFELFIKTMNIYEQIEREDRPSFATDAYKPQKRTDLHMQYLKLDKKGLWTNKDPNGKMTMQILVSPASYDKEQCAHLLKGGFENLADGSIDITLVSTSQFTSLDDENIKSLKVDNYILLWNIKNKNLDLVVAEVEKLKERLTQLNQPESTFSLRW